jgi:Fic family protein
MHMYDQIHQFEPLIPQRSEALSRWAEKLIAADRHLCELLHEKTAEAVRGRVQTMNCYYSNLIEGHQIPPADIERALRNDFSETKSERDLQHLAVAHIHAETVTRELVESGASPYTNDFVLCVHREFCEKLPDDMLILDDGSRIAPGKFRETNVAVGHHAAPDHKALLRFMDRFNEVYSAPCPLPDKIIRIAAAHHRFVWIHPFADGNGRVGRLLMGAMLQSAGINSRSLWSLSRGFAKGQSESDGGNESYKSRLHNADQARMGNYDGRGNLSTKRLEEFCSYTLRAALDQAQFMTTETGKS